MQQRPEPKKYRCALKLCIAASALFSSFVSNAEELDSISNNATLNEITVTATKQNLLKRELASSVSLIGKQLLEQTQFQGIKDLNAYIPNVYIPDFGSSLSTPIFIRGIGSRRINMVGLYSDGVPLLEGGSIDTDYSDVRSVEVLRGPQGTIYGRGAMGGIINLTSYRPLDYQGTHINLHMGQYGQAGLSAQSYQAIHSRLGISASANYQHRGGFYTNIYNGEKADRYNNVSGKFALQYRHNGWDIYGYSQYQNRKQGGYPYSVVDKNDILGDVNYNLPSEYNRQLFTSAVNVQKRFSNNLVLKSSSSYQHLSDEMIMDQDFTRANMVVAKQYSRKNIWTEEINLSRSNNRYSWVTGIYGFYINSHKDLDNNINIPQRRVEDVFISYGEPSYGFALFHQSSYKITSRLTAELGLRLDWEHSEQDYYKHTTNHLRQGRTSEETQPAKTVDRQFTPKASLIYRIGDEHRVYATVLRGYQSGGFNVQFDRPEEQSYKPEYSWNYELGTHLFFAGGKLQLDASLFYIDWRSQQVQQAVQNLLGSKMTNAGRSRSLGAEFAIAYRPIENLNLAASYGYTKTSFVEYNEFVQQGQPNASRNGNYIPQVPQHTVAASAKYTIKLGLPWIEHIDLGIQYRGLGNIYWNSANTQLQHFYSTLDAQVGLTYKALSIELWGKNLSNANYRPYQFSSQGQTFAQRGLPKHFGGTLRIKL